MNNKNNLPTSASFLVTENCNLHCKYCFEKHNKNKMTKEVARKGLDFLCNNAIKNKEKEFHAMIFGGEPWLMPDVVEEIFKHGVELAKKHNMFFSTSLVTNATILNTNIETIINRYKNIAHLSVQLSVDGIKKTHDLYRVTRDGKGSFDIIEKNIPRWKMLFADNIHRLSVHGCCNHETLPYLYESYIFFREQWQIPRIWFMPIHSDEWTKEDIKIYEEQLNKIADYILEDVKKTRKIDEVMNYAPIDRCLSPDRFTGAPCGAGKNFITITANGELFPCHQIYFNDPDKYTKIGDLDTGIDELKRKIFIDYDSSDLSCKQLDPECDAYHCYRCIGDNLQHKGSLLSVVDCGGAKCKMSKIERKIQLKVRGELKKMGLLNKNGQNITKGNNPNNPDCLCDSRGGDVQLSNSIDNNTKQINIKESDNEIIAMALKFIINKLDSLDKGQEYILTKLFK